MKKVLKIAAAIVVVLGIIWGATEAWGRSRIAANKENWQQDLTAETARIALLRRPTLRGDPVDDNAASAYIALIKSLPEASKKQGLDDSVLSKAAKEGPSAAFPPEMAQYLEAHRADVAALREATQRARLDWGIRYEDGFGKEVPSIPAAKMLGNLLVLEGHEQAKSGNLQSAAQRYLDAVRFGADFGTSADLVMDLTGIDLSGKGLEALGTLVTSQDQATLPLEQIAAELDKLEPILPSVVDGFRGERLAMQEAAMMRRSSLSHLRHPPAFAQSLLSRLIPPHALYAEAVSEMGPILRKMERAAAAEDPRESDRMNEEAATLARKTWNPLTSTLLQDLLRQVRASSDNLRVRFAMVSTAVGLEQGLRKDGHYPAELAKLPVDPFAYPAKIHYQPSADGHAYKLWSVGYDGKDDGGAAGDNVLERSP